MLRLRLGIRNNLGNSSAGFTDHRLDILRHALRNRILGGINDAEILHGNVVQRDILEFIDQRPVGVVLFPCQNRAAIVLYGVVFNHLCQTLRTVDGGFIGVCRNHNVFLRQADFVILIFETLQHPHGIGTVAVADDNLHRAFNRRFAEIGIGCGYEPRPRCTVEGIDQRGNG